MTPNDLLMYQGPNGEICFKNDDNHETILSNLNQVAQLFGRKKSTIQKHIQNIFKDKKLSQNQTVAFFATVQIEGLKCRMMSYQEQSQDNKFLLHYEGLFV